MMAYQLGLQINLKSVIRLEGAIYACDFNAFNTVAMGSADKSVSVWEWTQTGFEEAAYSPLLGHHDYAVVDVSFTKDGLTLVSSSADGKSSIFDVETGALVTCLIQSIGGNVRKNAISQSSPVLATVTDQGYIFLWSLQTYQNHRFWFGHDACINSLAISPDSFLVATGDSDGTFKLWLLDRAISSNYAIDSFTVCVQKDSHAEGVVSIDFSPEHSVDHSFVNKQYTMCTGGEDNLIKLWRIAFAPIPDCENPDADIQCIMKFEGHTSSITAIQFSSDGRFIGSTSFDGYARMWEVRSGSCLRVLSTDMKSMFCCCFSPNSEFFVTGSYNKSANVWQLTNEMVPPTTHSLVSIGDRVQNRTTDQTTFNELQTIHVNSSVNSLDFNSEYDLIVGCSDKTVRVYKLRGNIFSEMAKLSEHLYSVTHVEFSSSGLSFLSGANDGSVFMWNNPIDGDISKTCSVNDRLGDVSCLSPFVEWIALGANDGCVHIYSTRSHSIVTKYEGHTEGIKCLAFTPDGEYFASGCSGGVVKVWKANPPISKCQLLIDNVHDLGVMACDFSQNFKTVTGKFNRVYRLATGGNDSLIKVYKLEPKDELSVTLLSFSTLIGHGGSITEVRFTNKSSDILASTSIDRTARIWNSVTGQCLHVINKHKGIVNCCTFSLDTTFFVTGSLDGTLRVWKVPKAVTAEEDNVDAFETAQQLQPEKPPIDPELDKLAIKLDDLVLAFNFNQNSREIPDHMLCPITRQVMTDPVICSDGFTYERNAITTWLATGRNSSPMLNVPLSSSLLTPNVPLQNELKQFLLRNYSGVKK